MMSFLALLLNLAFAFAAGPPLEGSYIHSCYLVGDDVLSAQVDIKGDDWARTYTAYEDENCKKAYLKYETRYRAQVLGTQLDLATAEVSYVSLTDEVTEALNMVAYCGYNNWQTHQKKIVTGVLCDEFQNPKKGEKIYTIFDLKTQSDGSRGLYLGTSKAGQDGKSLPTRHSEYEPAPYILLQTRD